VNTSTTAALSTESVQTFLQQIETQLLSSDAYQQLVTALQNKLGGIAEEFQSLVTALGREAIQYTIHQLMGAAQIAAPEESLESAIDSSYHQDVIVESVVEPMGRSQSLLQLGQKIKQGRKARGLTLQELHHQTYVPLHHLKSLELGELDKLPEDVFLRGFVRQIGKALENSSLVDFIPSPEPIKQPAPSWKQKARFQPVAQISPVHLYVGYAALMAGAVGGLTWISQPAQPDAPAAKPTSKAQVNSFSQAVGQVSSLVQANVSPPETMP
jgi:cytoskeleton protein RodZ